MDLRRIATIDGTICYLSQCEILLRFHRILLAQARLDLYVAGPTVNY